MKTKTRSKLLEIIRKNGASRPIALAKSLKISPQALHRHLKQLHSQGLLEMRGKPPMTEYVLTDHPDLESALSWAQSDHATSGGVNEICETRDVFTARLNRFVPLAKCGLPEQDISLLIAIAGEIGNNSFDHNLGQWHDQPGCWFEIQQTRNRIWILVADRGQGILHSLTRVLPNIKNDEDALRTAFEEHVSGRSPEKRGNGLKFVRGLVTKNTNKGLVCTSGKGRVIYGDLGHECELLLKSLRKKIPGTLTLVGWEIK